MLGSIAILLVAFVLSLQFSAVQTYLTQHIAKYLSEELESDIRLERVYFKPFSSLALHNFVLHDKNGQLVLAAGELHADLVLNRIWQRQLTIEGLKLKDAAVHFEIYEDSTNFTPFVRYFSPAKENTNKSKSKMQLDLRAIELHNNSFKLVNHNFNHHNRGVDFSDLEITALSGVFKGLVLDSVVRAEIEGLTLQEKSGLHLRELSTKASYGPKAMEFVDLYLATNRSVVRDYLKFEYNSMKDFSDFIRQVHVIGNLVESYVDSRDIEFFAPSMKNVRFETAVQTAEVSGTVSDLTTHNAHFTMAQQTELVGDFTIKGLPDINQTIFDIRLDRLQTSPQDVEYLVSKFANTASFLLPDQVHRFANVDFRGAFRGLYNDFQVDGDFETALGALSTNSQIDIRKGISYAGTLQTQDFNVGEFVAVDALGTTAADLSFEGRGLTLDDLHLQVAGILQNIEAQGYTYDNIVLDGILADRILDVEGDIKDINLQMQYATIVDWRSETPNYSLDADIDFAHLKNLKWFQKDSVALHRAHINTNLVGNNINNITGYLEADSLLLTTSKGEFAIDHISFTAEGGQDDRILYLNSDVVDAKMYGEIDLNTISAYFASLAMRYAPAIGIETKAYNPQNFDLEVNVKSLHPIVALVDPTLSLAKGSYLKATFLSDSLTANFIAFSPKVEYKGLKMTNLAIHENADKEAFSLNVDLDRLSVSDSVYVNAIAIRNVLANDSLRFNITMSEPTATNHLDLKGNIHFAHNAPAYIAFDPSIIVINKEQWGLNDEAMVRVSKGKIHIDNLILSQATQKVSLTGIMSGENDKLLVDFSNFNLTSLNGITNPLGIHLEGAMNGKVAFTSLFRKPFASANLQTGDITYNQIGVGRLNLLADLDPTTGLANIDLKLADEEERGLVLQGNYNFFDENEKLDISGKLNKTDLAIFQPFLKNLVSNLSGKGNGDVRIKGTFKNPKISGIARIEDAGFTVNYLQTHYRVENQAALVENNAIMLQNLVLRDVYGQRATANGIVNLERLATPFIDVDIVSDNVMILNTTYRDNNLYYGRAFASGTFRFKGFTSAIDININARSEANTVITIPFNSAMTVTDSDFVYFVSSDSTENAESQKRRLFRGLTMNMDLQMTPDAEINLPTDLGTLTGNGEGQIGLKITSLGDFEMFGDYVVSKGKFHFTAQDFINKYFDIKEGGTVRWTGEPSDAIININAIYQQRTGVGALYNAAGRAGEDERVLAQADMLIKGTLEQPDVTFDLNFPQNPYIKDQLQSYLSDANNVNQQALSLIVRRSFTPSSTNEIGREVNNTLLSAGTEIAFNQLNSIISQSLNINFFDLNIRSFNDASASVRLLNDRLTLTGGITDRTNYLANDLTFFREGVTTDAELTYRLRKDGSLLLRAYNRPYTRNFLIRMNDAEYISAVGLVYRQEFNSLLELWRKMWIWRSRNEDKQEEEK